MIDIIIMFLIILVVICIVLTKNNAWEKPRPEGYFKNEYEEDKELIFPFLNDEDDL